MTRMTVRDLLATKGKRRLTKLAISSPEHAVAAQAAEIDVVTARMCAETPALRQLAPDLFFIFGLRHGETVTEAEEMRRAFVAREAGADAVYCPMRLTVVEALSMEGIPVVGHVGLVPRKATWTGGMKPIGKTAHDAWAVYQAVKAYEAAGAIAVEMELVPDAVATEISQRTSMIVFSMGSGGGCDGDFLFAADILGETQGHIPRHARVYMDMAAEYARLNHLRTQAMRRFREDVGRQDFPSRKETVTLPETELSNFLERIEASLPQ